MELQEIESDLVRLVKEILDPLFVLFGFFQLGDAQYERIIIAFVEGRVV